MPHRYPMLNACFLARPATGAEIFLQGLQAFEAAMHCACVRAAQRSLQQQQAALLRQQQEAEEQQRQQQLRQQVLAAQAHVQRLRSPHAHTPVRRHSYSGAGSQQLIFPLPELRPTVQQQQRQQGGMPPTPDPSTLQQVRAATAADPAVGSPSAPQADQPLPATRGSMWPREAMARLEASRNDGRPADAPEASLHAQTPNTQQRQQQHHLLRGGNTTTSPQQQHREHQQALAAQVAQMFAERQQQRQQEQQRRAPSTALLPPAPTLPAAPVAGLSASALIAGLIQEAAEAVVAAAAAEAADAYPSASVPAQASATPLSAAQAPPASQAPSRSQLLRCNTHSGVPATASAAGVPSSQATPAASAAAAAATSTGAHVSPAPLPHPRAHVQLPHSGDMTDAEDSGSFAAAPQHQHPLLCTHHHHPAALDHTGEAGGSGAMGGRAAASSTGATTDALRSMPCGAEAAGSFDVAEATTAPLGGAAAAGPVGGKQAAPPDAAASSTSAVLPLRYTTFPQPGMQRGGSATAPAAAAASSGAPNSSDAIAAATVAAARPGRSSGMGAFRFPGCFSFPRGLPAAVSEVDLDEQHHNGGALASPPRMYGSAQQPTVRVQLRSAPYVPPAQPHVGPAEQLPSAVSTVRTRGGNSSNSSNAAHSGAGGSSDALGAGRKLFEALLPVAGLRRLKTALAQRFGAGDEA